MVPVERFSSPSGQAVVMLWVQRFHCLPPSSQGLVCTRWHCNNTCYTTPFIYKKTPTTPKAGGVTLECTSECSHSSAPFGLLANECCHTRGSAVIEPGCDWNSRILLSTAIPLVSLLRAASRLQSSLDYTVLF